MKMGAIKQERRKVFVSSVYRMSVRLLRGQELSVV